MNNFDTARSALETSLKSSGSAMKEHEKWQQSLEARINSLKASWQSLSQTFLSSNFLKVGMDWITGFVDAIDNLIDRYGVINTLFAGRNLFSAFKRGFALDADGNQVGAYWGITNSFKGLGTELKTVFSTYQQLMGNFKGLSWKFAGLGAAGQEAGQKIKEAFKGALPSIKTMLKDIAKVIVIMNIIKAAQDIFSWISEAGEDAETTAEKFNRISEELSGVESELSGLESELSSVESQIDTLLEKDELTFADEEELSRLRDVSSELERQIQLAETLQESLNKSLSATAIDAYDEYASATSFYSDKSKQERKEAAKSTGNSIGNIVGLLAGLAISFIPGVNIGAMPLMAAGSLLGSGGGNLIGGAISDASYDSETTVKEMLDRMHIEMARLTKLRDEAKDTYYASKNPTAEERKAYEDAEAALSNYNTTLAEHIRKLSEYHNSADYNTLNAEDKEEYLEDEDLLHKYNILMGVKGAKSTAFDRIFSDELVTKEARGLRDAIEATLNSGEEINFADFDSKQFADIKERLADMGLTIVDVVSYFEDLAKAEEEAANNFETYEVVSNIAALSDGVTALTDAFAEFNEQGIVTAKTLAELHEVFGGLGEDWTNYVDIMTNGIATVDDARKATEQLVEAYTDNLFKSGGIKFSKVAVDDAGNAILDKFGKETYEFDKDGYKTYLSTINELENLGVENAKEYVDALQQQAMVRESAAQIARDSAEKEALLAKETLTEKEKTRLSVLEAKKIDDYISEIETTYGIRLKDSGLVKKQYELDEYNSIIKDREEQLGEITNYLKEYDVLSTKAETAYTDYKNAKDRAKEIENEIVSDEIDSAKYAAPDSGFPSITLEDIDATLEYFGADWLNTRWDDIDNQSDIAEGHYAEYEKHLKSQKDKFENMVEIAKEANIDLSDIIPDVDNFEFDATADNAAEIFEQVYNRVESELNSSIDKYEDLASEASAEIEARLNNLGLEIDFGRNFDKIVIDGFKTKIDQFNTAKSEIFSGAGLSTDSIIAVDDIFGDLGSYDSSKLFENTLNGVRLNTEEFKRLSDEFKNVNIGALEGKLSDLGDQYVETRDELNKLTYGTIEYDEKARELEGIGKQIEANEELLSQYQALFSSYQEWQRAESAGSERNMYETILEGWESVGDEISRGWVDEGTREFLELLKGEKATIIDGEGNKKEIDIATASAKELKQVWKGLDDTIKHTTYSVQDFFTVDEDGNSTSQGVYNFLDAIGQMEEEKFLDKDGKPIDVVRRDSKNNIIGFDFQIAGGDEAIAKALGVSEELVQIMKRAAIDAGFAVTFDGSFEQLDVLKEKAESAAKEMNEILKADGKATIDIDMNVDSVDKIQPQIDKIMETFGKKDANGKLTGEIDMGINGADKALGIVRTLQSMLDEVTRPAYMDIQIGQVEEELRDPLYQLQQLRTYVEQEHQLKLSGGDTSELEKSKQEIYDYFEELDPKIKAKVGLVDDKGNGITEESFNKLTGEQKIKLGYVDEDGKPITDFSKAIEKKLNDGSLSIEATVDLQIEMADSLDILAQTALFEQGKISKEEYDKRISVYIDAEVDNEDAKDKTDGAVDDVTDGEDRKQNIEIIASVTGIEDIDGLTSKLDGLDDKTVQAIAEVLGKTDVDSLKDTFSKLDDKTVKAIAEAVGKGDVEGLKNALINIPDEKHAQAIAEAFGYKDVNELAAAVDGMDGNTVQAVAQALGLSDVNTLQITINNMQGNTVDAKVDTSGQKEKIDTLQGWIDGLKGRIVTVGVQLSNAGRKKANQRTGADPAGNDSEVNGTANVNGTIGRALKRGDWRTKKTETALTGELGREIVVTPQNRWYTVGDNGAEFVNIPRGSIVFNHRQTEELLRNGKAISDGGRARALVNGTAFLGGTAHRGEGEWVGVDVPSFKVGYDYKSGSDKDSDKSQNIFDWIEVAIERIEREIDNLDRTANNVYKSWTSRNKALADEISEVGNEIALQQKAYEGYMSAANEIGLSSEWKKKVQNGAIDIDNITDDVLKEKIDDYQKYYEAALDCKDAIEELKETEAELYAQRVENVATQYEGILGVIEHEKNIIEEYISQSEANAQLTSGEYYKALISNENKTITQLQNQKNGMIAKLQEAMNAKDDQGNLLIVKGSEAWYSMIADIDEVTLAITESQTQIKEWNQTIQQLSWETFDILQDKISAVTEEADFLIELMSSDKLHDDNGKLTDEGSATMGLHGQNYNAYMYQADLAAKEAERLKKQMSSDGYDTDLEERYREMIALQQEYILNAENEKNAIRDLVSDGIELELDALQELIDKKNEELESERDLYEYQKKVLEQTKEISSLEKQIASYSGDDSEEAKAKIQELKVSLEEAKADLEETEYDKYISDQGAMLDELYLSYEEVLNTRLDNLDALVSDMIAQINADATSISTTLSEKADSVGYTLSNSMTSIWDTNSTKINGVITTYGEKFVSAQTTTNTALGVINTNLQNMITQLNKLAKTDVKSASISSAANDKKADNPKPPTTPKQETPKTTTPTVKVGGMVNASGAQIYDYAGDTSGERQLYRNDPKYKVLKESGNWIQVRWHKLSSGITGWFKKGDVRAYKSGVKNLSNSQMAWTQENGKEFIVRPSDGAILTPLAKKDSVLDANASNNIWNMANSPAEFIKDNLNLGAASIPNNSNVQNNYTQHLDKVVFNMPNIRNYEEFLHALKDDRRFEKLVTAMTIDKVAGKSSLAKGKSIR